MKAKKGQINEKLMVIKLFRSNYARDLMFLHLIYHNMIEVKRIQL